MSVQTTNSSKFQEFHGIKLAGGAAIANLIVEKLAVDPLTPAVGRFWFNTADNKFKMVSYTGTEAVVKTFTDAAELAQAIVDLKALLAADGGSALVGYDGQTGTNGKFSLVASKVDAALDAITVAVDAEIKNRETADTDAAAALAAATGATLVGYAGKAGAKGEITVLAGTVKGSLDSLVDQVDAAFGELSGDAVSKSTLVDQAIASKVTFGKDVIVTGSLTVIGENTLIQGTTVAIGDNILLLNSKVAPDATPNADAGFEVNRGIKGTLEFIIWDESAKQTVAPSITIATEDNVELGIEIGDEVVTMSRVILGIEFDAFDLEVTGRVVALETQVNGKIGDLTALATEDKTKLVLAINELHADAVTDRSNLVASTGGTLVGYAGKAGVEGLLTVAEGTVTASLDALVTFVDAEAKATDTFISDVASTTAGKGSGIVGYSGYGAVKDLFFVPAGTVQATLSAVVVAIQEDRADIVALEGASAAVVTAINAKKFVTTSSAAMTHTIVHGLNTMDIGFDVWFKDGTDWVNHSASCKIVDANTIEFTLTVAAEIKVLVKSFTDITL